MHRQGQAASASEQLDTRPDLAAGLGVDNGSDRHGQDSTAEDGQRRVATPISRRRANPPGYTLSAVTDYTPAYYDPMDTEHVTAAICQELERQPLIPLDPLIARFDGSGLYAIYYSGKAVALYAPLSDRTIPVYVGQALSHNSATGVAVREPRPLWGRVRDHHTSINGSDLPAAEFGVRLLRLPDVHADLGENGLRVFYVPVWNAILSGFGSHEQGSRTRQGARSKWDTVHPGRSRTFGSDTHDKDELIRAVREHIAAQLARYREAPWH